MIIQERIKLLRSLMEEKGYDMYIVPSDDSHQSEYVSSHFKAREFITGFTGSAGTFVITRTDAGLFTDGRYFIQAGLQLSGSGITLFKSGQPGVPSLEAYITSNLPIGGVLGFDGRMISAKRGRILELAAAEKKGCIRYFEDLVGLIWKDRPPLPQGSAFLLEETYAGESVSHKLMCVREAMSQADASVHVMASLDDICWLTNLRGQDIEFSPLLLSYALITMDEMRLYADRSKFSSSLQRFLLENGITLCPYEDIYKDLPTLSDHCRIMIDPSRINYALYHLLPDSVQILEQPNPAYLMKSVKNETELQNIVRAHIKDGVAVTRFMYWLKKELGHTEVTELSAAQKLESLRASQKGYLGPSFEPICAFAEHGAIVHYSASSETDRPLREGSFFLTDTGGNYLEGSTDITRTFALGNPTARMKEDFTTVLLCNLRLARAKFPQGTPGHDLDVLSRAPIWERGMNYNHGTGHGVGYLLNIHEGPAGFSAASREEAIPLQPGMVLTDEPGLYLEGLYGIRTENELIVRKGPSTEYGQFLYFEPITCVPIDLDAVNPDLLSPEDKAQLNAYHANVYETIAPHLCQEEQDWLKEYTRPV